MGTGEEVEETGRPSLVVGRWPLAVERSSYNPFPFLILAVWILWVFGFQTVGARLTTELDGLVVLSQDIPPGRGPRYATEYTLRGPDGVQRVYVAGATDASLPRSLPVGTYLCKKKWSLNYTKNGNAVNDFPIFFYVLTLGTAIGCLGWSLPALLGRHPFVVRSANCADA